MSTTRLGVIIGRFQPIHNSHVKLIEAAAKESDRILILVGSGNRAIDPRNPFSHNEREVMIDLALQDTDFSHKYSVASLNDHMYNDAAWLAEVSKKVDREIAANTFDDDETVHVTIYGHDKDNSTYYLNNFPTYHFREVGSLGDLDATRIRDAMYNNGGTDVEALAYVQKNVPPRVSEYLANKFMYKGTHQHLVEEYEYLKQYKEAWTNAPYEPTFTTSDAVVYYKGQVLLVKRKSKPGFGQWALPGGFVNSGQWINDAIVSNLKKETRIKVGDPILQSNLRKVRVFDDPSRSLRGRIITHAGLIVLDNVSSLKTPPQVRQGREVEHSKWVPVAELDSLVTTMFEDHYFIIKQMLRLS